MPNIRIIHDNAFDRASSVVASSTAGNLTVSNLSTEYKGQVHRSTTTNVTYTVNWSSPETVNGVCIPATNLTASATIRVQLYTNTTLLADSTTIYACPGDELDLWNWSQSLNANAFVYGGAARTAVWFSTPVSCNKCVVTITDTTNTAGYIDCARLVIGQYWEPKYNVSNGISVTLNDTSSNTRNESGDLLSSRGVVHDVLSFDFSVLVESDKQELLRIMRRVGSHKNILISIFPDGNSLLEQSHMIYGKRSNSAINTALYGIYKHSMDIEGW